MNNYVQRDVEHHVLPLPDGTVLENTPKIVLQVCDWHRADLGSLCYLQRSNAQRHPFKGRCVVLGSLCPSRTAEVARLVTWVCEQYNHGFWRPTTLGGHIRELTKFIDWCDAAGHHSVLTSVDGARSSLRAYVQDLRLKVSKGEMRNNTACIWQKGALTILKNFFAANDLTRGINLLREKEDLKNLTPVPSDNKVGRLLGLCTALFDGFCDLALDFKPYPYAIEVPPFLEWPDNRLWIFPLKRWRVTPEEDISDTQHIPRLVDYATGRVEDPDIFRHLYSDIYVARHSADMVRQSIADANENPYNEHRFRLGVLAAAAFYVLFIAATGMNGAQAMELPWCDDLNNVEGAIHPDRQNFRAVKYRAGGKTVSFTMSARTIPLFLRYLTLRKYLLNGRDFDYLFVDLLYRQRAADILNRQPRKPNKNFEYSFAWHLDKLTKKVPRVTPRELRTAKQDFLIRNYDPITTATLMQHSLRTTVRKYSAGSAVQAQKEIGEFLIRVEDIVLDRGAQPLGSSPRPLGVCVREGSPKPLIENPPAVPDCKRQEGCLYCKQYRVHADEIDARKLLSLHYCLRKTVHFAESAEQHDAVFGHILRRIDFLIGEIGKRDTTMLKSIETIRNEVNVKGRLTPYWAGKLEFLMSLSELV